MEKVLMGYCDLLADAICNACYSAFVLVAHKWLLTKIYLMAEVTYCFRVRPLICSIWTMVCCSRFMCTLLWICSGGAAHRKDQHHSIFKFLNDEKQTPWMEKQTWNYAANEPSQSAAGQIDHKLSPQHSTAKQCVLLQSIPHELQFNGKKKNATATK